jgi:hypothetical protein
VATKHTFTQRLKREITASPQKAAMLALVCVVALWFWTPLVLKWVGKKSPVEDSVAVSNEEDSLTVAPIVAAAVVLEAETSATAATTTPVNWRKILQCIQSDPKMKPHVTIVGRRDPFSSPASTQVAKVEEPPPPPAPEITPQEAGIFVSSTVVGFNNRTALINGRSYREQQEIAGTKLHERFSLVEIRAKSIIVERNGRHYEVRIPNLENVQFDD